MCNLRSQLFNSCVQLCRIRVGSQASWSTLCHFDTGLRTAPICVASTVASPVPSMATTCASGPSTTLLRWSGIILFSSDIAVANPAWHHCEVKKPGDSTATTKSARRISSRMIEAKLDPVASSESSTTIKPDRLRDSARRCAYGDSSRAYLTLIRLLILRVGEWSDLRVRCRERRNVALPELKCR